MRRITTERADGGRWQICDPSDGDSIAESLAVAAHELRLPLSHIKGFVTSLRRTDVEWDATTRNEFLAEIDQETDRLAILLETLLGARRGNDTISPGLNFELVEAGTVVRGALHRTRGLLRDRLVQLDLAPNLPLIPVDGSRMEQVLANLVENAAKYSPPGTPIDISARITADGSLELSVADNGPGVPIQDRERIFEPFVRGDAAKRSSVGGTGLGLAISRCIVAAHGGRIYVNKGPRGGASFHVVLPTSIGEKAA